MSLLNVEAINIRNTLRNYNIEERHIIVKEVISILHLNIVPSTRVINVAPTAPIKIRERNVIKEQRNNYKILTDRNVAELETILLSRSPVYKINIKLCNFVTNALNKDQLTKINLLENKYKIENQKGKGNEVEVESILEVEINGNIIQ